MFGYRFVKMDTINYLKDSVFDLTMQITQLRNAINKVSAENARLNSQLGLIAKSERFSGRDVVTNASVLQQQQQQRMQQLNEVEISRRNPVLQKLYGTSDDANNSTLNNLTAQQSALYYGTTNKQSEDCVSRKHDYTPSHSSSSDDYTSSHSGSSHCHSSSYYSSKDDSGYSSGSSDSSSSSDF